MVDDIQVVQLVDAGNYKGPAYNIDIKDIVLAQRYKLSFEQDLSHM